MFNIKIRRRLAGKKTTVLALVILAVVIVAAGAARAVFFQRGVGAPRSYITTPILDNFNRPDEDPLNPSNWSKVNTSFPHDGGSFNFRLINGQINNDSGSGGNTGMATWNTAFAGDQEAYFTASFPTGYDYWVLLNIQGASGYSLNVSGGGIWTISRVDGSTPTVLATVSGPVVNTGDVLIGRHVGSRLSFSYLRNGKETEILTATDSTYTGNKIGLMVGGSNHADNFGGGSLHGSGLQLSNLEKGLVARWKLDGNAKNATPYNINCSRGGGSSDVADRKGQAASSISWTGAGHGSINCGQPSALQFPSGSVSISAWVKPSVFVDSTGGIAGSVSGYYLATDASGFAKFKISVSGGQSSIVTSTAPLSLSTWYLLTGTYDGSSARLYINGQLDASVPETRVLASFNNDFTIASLSSTNRDFYGAIDDVRIYNRALSPDEISKLYRSYNSNLSLGGSGASGSISLAKGLVGRWTFNGNRKDSTPNANDCDLPAGASPTADRKGVSNAAYSFAGGSFMRCGLDSALEPANSVSLSAWIKPSAFTYGEGGIASPGEAGYGLYTDTAGLVYFGATGPPIASSAPLSLNTWYLVTGTYDGTTERLYINGSLAASATYPGTLGYTNTGYPFEIGTYIQSGGRTFVGAIDDVRVYNRALSSAEVQALYNTYN